MSKSTRCVNNSVARFGQKLLWRFPRPVGQYYGCCAMQEENCKRNSKKNFLPNLETKLLTHSVEM